MKDFTITHIAGTELSLPMLFKFIDAKKGKPFQFQADDGTEYGSGNEGIKITFKENFWLCAYQTTQEFWEAVVEASPNAELQPKPSHYLGKTRPVEQINWYDTKLFNEALNTLINISEVTFFEKPKNLGLASLPSETQWEYGAAASLNNTVYSSSDQLNDVAWYSQNSKATMPVALKEANAFGLFDMTGNVWEWCADDFHSDLSKMPLDGSQLQIKSDYKSLRGGSYFDDAGYSRLRIRNFTRPDNRNSNIGFRLRFSPSSTVSEIEE